MGSLKSLARGSLLNRGVRSGLAQRAICPRCLHTSALRFATPLPMTATGPPPAPPAPSPSEHQERLDRRRRQLELIKDVSKSKHTPQATPSMKRRFWKDVSVKSSEQDHLVLLDSRAVRNPLTNPPIPLQIPVSKLQLATAIALEWDLLTSAADALRGHLVPLTSLASRAHSLAMEDSRDAKEGHLLKGEGTRYDIVNMLLRYLDTDTLLCWAPEAKAAEGQEVDNGLRDKQMQLAKPILSYLTQKVWPGAELNPTLADGSILPRAQPASTRAVVKGWLAGLPAWELAALERATLASKSLCIATRLVAEWSEELRLGEESNDGQKRFGVEEAAQAATLEVQWQTGQWGEVEDTHDVDREDVRKQLGSAVLLISGDKGR